MPASTSTPTSSDIPWLADFVNYLSYLAHSGHKQLPSLNDLIKRAQAISKASRTEQMDALTAGAIALTVCAAVAFIFYKLWNKDEDTFAKARANKQITLLEDVAPKKKNDDKKEKEKQQKKKEEKKKKAAASADSKEDKPAAAPAAAASAPAAPQESPKPAPVAPKKEQPKPEEPKKKEKESPVKASAPAPVAEPAAVKKEEAAPLQTAAPEQKKAAQSNGEKKANKKPAAPKQVEEIENEEEFVEAKTKKAKKTEKKEAAPAVTNESTAPRHLSLKDLDTNKVVTRLSSIDEIEVEYIEYLNNFFRDTADKAARTLTESVRAARLADEGARALATVKAEKTKLEAELDSNRRLTHELAQKAATAGSEQQELKSKLAALGPEMDKLRRDLDASRKAAAAVVIPVVPDNKEELEKLKADAKSAAARLADLEEQLKNAKESAAKERKQHEQSVLLQKTREDAAVGQEVLLAESRQNAKAISQRLTELEQVKETLEQRVAEATKQADELKEQADKREATHAADTLSLKTMIEELNKEVHRFEEAKREQTEMVAKLAAKEAELVKKSEALKAAEDQISEIKKGSDVAGQSAAAEIKTLTTRVAELEKALAEEQKRAAEVVIPVAEPKKEEIEEVVELKKSAFLDAAPPAADNSEELAALKQENEELKKEQTRLQEKNSELRTRSHAMVDQLSAMEKRFVANGVAAPSTSDAPAAAAAEEKSGKSKKSKKGGEKKETAPAPAAAPKEEKKDEEERVRAERRLVQSHIGKVLGGATPALDDAADSKAYEQWLKSVGASIKEAQEKLKKSQEEAKAKKTQPAPAPAPVADDDAEKEQLRAENEKFREAFATLEDELQTIEQLKTEREESYIRRIAELEKTHGKAPLLQLLRELELPYPEHHQSAAPAEDVQLGDLTPPTPAPPERVPRDGRLSASKQRIVAEIRCCHAIRMQIAEVRSAMDALPALTVPAAAAAATPAADSAPSRPAPHSPPTSQSEDDGSWEVVA